MLRGPYEERTSFSGVDSWREKSDGESSGFGVEFDPPVEVLFHHCDDSNNAPPCCWCIVREDRKGGSRASLARPFLSRSPLLPIPPSSTYPSVYIYSYLFSYGCSFIPCLLARATRSIPPPLPRSPPFFHLFIFIIFLFFLWFCSAFFCFFVFGKSKGLVFSTLRISPQPLRSKRRRE